MFPIRCWVLAILWLDLSFAVVSVRVADTSIFLEVQCGSLDVGVSVLAACSCAASSSVPAPVVAAFPFLSCGLALSAELRLYPVCFQSWNFDGVIGSLSLEMALHWTFLRDPWTLDETFVDDMVDGSGSWIQSGFLRRLMATVGCSRAAALFVVTNLLIVDLFSTAAAFGGLINQVTVPAAAAAAAAIVVAHALSSLDESAAGAKNDEFSVCVVQAAAAWVAPTVAVHSLCESSLVVFFSTGAGSWIFLWVTTSFPGQWKEQRNISSQSKDEEASNLQALIPEASRVEGPAFDDQLDTFKGKDRHDTDGSLSLGLGERLPDGWTSRPVSSSSSW